jgi:3-oxoacyl-[acyl-carrier-protein] synthase III
MRFEHVHLESVACELPARRVSSEELELRLAPLYARLGLSIGRLELMSGIRERRFFEPGDRPSAIATRAAERALARTSVPRERIGLLVHASVCRDFLEPASAAFTHRALELSPRCAFFDLSNACLGFANALFLAASRIERREIEAALVVSGEDGGPLVEATLRTLLEGPAIGKAELKRAFASLTIGAGGAAAVLAHSALASSPRRLIGGCERSASQHAELCRGDRMSGSEGLWMQTDSEALLAAGIELASTTWSDFQRELEWSAPSVERILTHQVGAAHRRLLLERLELGEQRDVPTYPELGNVGSAALPIAHALAEERGLLAPGQRIAWMGIGSGLGCSMLGFE